MAEEATKLPESMNRLQRLALIVGVAGLSLGLIGALIDSPKTANSYLFAWFFWLSVALGSLSIVMLHHMTGGDWGIAIRRTSEAAAMTLPLLALLFVPIGLSTRRLFPWANLANYDGPLRHVLEFQHENWFNVPAYWTRALIYFVIWIGVAFVLCAQSIRFDRSDNFSIARRMRKLSAVGLILYIILMTLAAVDWVMAREAGFYSTIIGFMICVGQALSAMVFAVALLPMTTQTEPLRGYLTPPRMNDLGNLVLTLVILWAYMTFSQLLVIWMGNIKTETPWYIIRGLGLDRNAWRYVGLVLLVFHFFVPFLLLLSRENKKQLRILCGIAAGLFVLRAVDIYWLIVPSGPQPGWHVYWTDLPLLLGIGGIWFALFVAILRRRPIVPHSESEPEANTHGHGEHGALNPG